MLDKIAAAIKDRRPEDLFKMGFYCLTYHKGSLPEVQGSFEDTGIDLSAFTHYSSVKDLEFYKFFASDHIIIVTKTKRSPREKHTRHSGSDGTPQAKDERPDC